MAKRRLPGVVVVGTASAVVAFVASFAVVADPTSTVPLYGTLLSWPILVAAFTVVNVDPEELPRFAVVFCGSLVGLTLLFGAVVDYRLLGAGIDSIAAADFVLAVNPVMAVLVGGALALSYYSVFEWGSTDSDGRTA